MRALVGAALIALAACSSIPPRTVAPVVLGDEATPAPRAAGQAVPLTTATWRPSGMAPPSGPARTPDEAVRAIAAAIDVWDVPALTSRVDPGGWTVVTVDGELTWRLMPGEAVTWMRERSPDRRIRATLQLPAVAERRDSDPVGDAYVRSVFTAFEGRDSVPMRVILRRGMDGIWYWSGIVVTE